MISSFNLSKLNRLLKDFYTLTKIRITVFDESFQELAAFPAQIAPFCQLIRTDPEGAKNCLRCDKEGCAAAARQNTAYTYRCHAGLTECIIPIHMGNIIIAYLFFGHVFSYPSHQEGWEQIKRCCGKYRLDMDALKDAVYEHPLVTEEYITSASHIMNIVASFLCLERMSILAHKELPVQIDEYLSQHFTEGLTIQQLCDHFQIGKTTLYEISTQNYGMGIASHLRRLRVDKAKQLLTGFPEMSVSQVAAQCGFDDYNYFITLFKRMTGVSPRKYRQNARKEFS
ncbi:MAG: PocR ligand-binding domain-containing protein [Eubacteriales bacterium]|nr:PocR ligand-binding domain-containing protein [Eubacteriales bacterium]